MLCAKFVPVFVSVTVAPGTIAPEGSNTVPVIRPVSSSANRVAAQNAVIRKRDARMALTLRMRIMYDLQMYVLPIEQRTTCIEDLTRSFLSARRPQDSTRLRYR